MQLTDYIPDGTTAPTGAIGTIDPIQPVPQGRPRSDRPRRLGIKLRRPHDARRSGFLIPRVVPRSWGYEEWFVATDRYLMKRLFIKAGERLSARYHDQRMETLVVVSGSCRVLLGKEGEASIEGARWYVCGEGEVIHLNARTVHLLQAIEDVVLHGVVTPHPADAILLRDRHGREII